MGVSLDPLPPHNPLVIDEGPGLRVQLLNMAMDIANREGSPLDADAPYFCLGGELVRFGRCVDLGGGVYRLSRLCRNVFRTTLVPSHVLGTSFILIDEDALRPIDGAFVPGELLTVEALGLGDASPVEASLTVEGLATTPLPPVHGTGDVAADGSVHFRWIRRSRMDSGWRDGVDQLMVEGSETYRITLYINAVSVGEWVSDVPTFDRTSAQLAALGMISGATASIAVRQIGRHAQSAPLTIEANY
jgi:hypothetical protein